MPLISSARVSATIQSASDPVTLESRRNVGERRFSAKFLVARYRWLIVHSAAMRFSVGFVAAPERAALGSNYFCRNGIKVQFEARLNAQGKSMAAPHLARSTVRFRSRRRSCPASCSMPNAVHVQRRLRAPDSIIDEPHGYPNSRHAGIFTARRLCALKAAIALSPAPKPDGVAAYASRREALFVSRSSAFASSAAG